jgi:hypothetical protein
MAFMLFVGCCGFVETGNKFPIMFRVGRKYMQEDEGSQLERALERALPFAARAGQAGGSGVPKMEDSTMVQLGQIEMSKIMSRILRD